MSDLLVRDAADALSSHDPEAIGHARTAILQTLGDGASLETPVAATRCSNDSLFETLVKSGSLARCSRCFVVLSRTYGSSLSSPLERATVVELLVKMW